MASTYEPIASQTLSSASSSVTFSSIPATYTDLVLVMFHVSNVTGPNLLIRFNGDTGSNYSRTFMYGFNNAPASGRESNKTAINTAGDNTDHMNIVHVMSYANTNVNKTVLDTFGGPGRIVGKQVGLWRSTAAVTSLSISTAESINSGSTFSLFGIKAAA